MSEGRAAFRLVTTFSNTAIVITAKGRTAAEGDAGAETFQSGFQSASIKTAQMGRMSKICVNCSSLKARAKVARRGTHQIATEIISKIANHTGDDARFEVLPSGSARISARCCIAFKFSLPPCQPKRTSCGLGKLRCRPGSSSGLSYPECQ
jgi:hypothetical protein